jgi:hypothetical protein
VSCGGDRRRETTVARRALTGEDGGGRRRATLGDDRPFYHACGGRRRLTSRPGVGLSATDRWATLQLFSNSKINAKIELSTGKLVKGWEKFSEKLWRKKVQFETTFVITTSSDSPQILNYSKDFKSNRIGSVLCSYKLIATHFSNQPELHLRYGAIHSALQTLH